ncbi:uncharacterized protein LOC114170208 [Vigna unguiculata]|uniref:uncharacterized protein LOC114170208 n=1 Tax=Vigna unguiculata TaxID=3917 RepID=UPI0010169B96|nr:uncharacterized protein LOC114170208 [Vigna unguiculata]
MQKNLVWHANGRKSDGLLRRAADLPQWKKIDTLYPQFGSDPRNLWLGLATDGMNPYGNLSSKHSSWPVLSIIYNLPYWLSMKRKYMMLSMMISGPKQPGNDIDVYLTPLIEDLRLLWEEGVEVFDAHGNDNFNLRALLKKAFNGCQEDKIAPPPLTGEEVYERVCQVNVTFGKILKKPIMKNIWKKNSIFFQLPYWAKLDVKHLIDVMHVEKNVCDSIIGPLLNIKGITKDDVNSCKDLIEMGLRLELQPQAYVKRTYLPPACHTLTKVEKKTFCACLREMKLPQGYSSNIKSLVSMEDLKLVSLKSHDCHVLMQQLLLVAIRGVLPKNVRQAITRLCIFFNSICQKVIEPNTLNDLENEAVMILCQLEMYFPPSFFDIMVHLIVHLVREIKICGPVFLRWMYPVERYMKILKGYVKNPYRPEASIIERYIAEEAIEFFTKYYLDVEVIGIPKLGHEGRNEGKGTRGVKVVRKDQHEVLQAHFYILNNTDDVIPYIDSHKSLLKSMNPREKRKKAQAIQQKNATPYRLSRGGYDLLEKRMMEEKLKKQTDIAAAEEVPSPPSPPSRHEKWKMARTKAGGLMTFEKSMMIAKRIISYNGDGVAIIYCNLYYK